MAKKKEKPIPCAHCGKDIEAQEARLDSCGNLDCDKCFCKECSKDHLFECSICYASFCESHAAPLSNENMSYCYDCFDKAVRVLAFWIAHFIGKG